jgi:ATP-binding cassette subfamily F protein 3
MIEFRNVSKHFGTQDVLCGAGFRINPGERAGITGRNGSGKSTIFELITGETAPDRGAVNLPGRIRLAHLRQQLHARDFDGSLLDYTAQAIQELDTLHNSILSTEHELPDAEGPERDRLLVQLGELQTRFEHLGGYTIRTRAEKALCGLGFAPEALALPFQQFSGGWQMRAELARTLIAKADVLLLDEPSNYLDLPAVEWLQHYLKDFTGTILLISHDRYLLESLTDITLEIRGGVVTRYAGNYAVYLQERETRREQQQAALKNQERKKEQIERFVERFRAKNTKASQVQSRLKQLEKMEEITAPEPGHALQALCLPEPPHSGAETAVLENVGLSYDGQRWIFRHVNLSILRGERVALVGYNGMGKTTLLRVLAGTLAPSEGTCRHGHKVVTGYQSQEYAETMPPEQDLLRIIKAAGGALHDAAARSLLGRFGFSGETIYKPVRVLSGGEKIRLAFARIFAAQPNLVLLDEPTTHLDIEAREGLQRAMKAYTGTLCFVSHDVAFTRAVANRIIRLGPNGLASFPGGYDYFREKTAERDSRHPHSTARPAGNRPPLRRVRRRERAQEREQQRRQTMATRRELRRLESLIETLESEQQRLLDQIAAHPQADYEQINRRLQEIQTALSAHNSRWETCVDALTE